MGVPPDKAPVAPSSGVGLSAHIRLAAGRGTSGCGGFACRLLALCASGPSAAAHIRSYPSRSSGLRPLITTKLQKHHIKTSGFQLFFCVYPSENTHSIDNQSFAV
ncbi:MAG: hypothetical protein ACK4EX_07545 [Thermaurantimonas sp.]|uniref:hypothetical protein n=1 Tax=Thermaurantimonas sp. TaxID=2681568 RepID=UPI00391946F9